MTLFVLILNILFLSTSVSHAYFGPGLGIGAISAVILFLVTIILLFFSIFSYPIKKAYNFFFKNKENRKDSKKKINE